MVVVLATASISGGHKNEFSLSATSICTQNTVTSAWAHWKDGHMLAEGREGEKKNSLGQTLEKKKKRMRFGKLRITKAAIMDNSKIKMSE